MSAQEALAKQMKCLRASFSANPWLWLVTIYTAMLAFHGISESDIPDFLRMARNTTQIMEPVNRQFLYSSPLNYMIGDFLGMPTSFGFFFIHGAEIVAMLGTILLCVRKKFPANDEQIRFIAFLSLTPLWLVTLKWIGKPDPLLITMMFLCWAYPGRWRWLFVTVMVMAHREMGSVMCLFLFAAEEKPDFSLIIPLLIGHAFHYLYENQILDQHPSSRVDDIAVNIWRHPEEFAQKPVLYFVGSLSWYWIVALWQRPTLRLCLVLTAAFGIAIVSEDFTRDFILMALAPLLFHLERVAKTPSAETLMRYLPLCLLQIQIAVNGIIFKPNNLWVDWMMGHLGDQLTR